MSKDLSDFTTEELEQESKRRRDEEKRIRDEKRERAREAMMPVVDALLLVIPHGRTSCSDKSPGNGIGSHSSGGHRCNRCALLDIKEQGYWPDDYHIDFQVPPLNLPDEA